MFDREKLSGVIPNQTELYYWADYVELLCLVDVDGHFSADRLAQRANFADDLMATSPDAQDADASDIADLLLSGSSHSDTGELDEGAEEVEDDLQGHAASVEDSDGEGEDVQDIGRAAELSDNRYEWCRQIFSLLRDRQRSVDAYPFEVDTQLMNIRRLPDLSASRMYIFFLCCSSLSYVSGSVMQRLTSHFELVSYHVLRTLLPDTVTVDMYGTARGLGSSQFTGTQYSRLKSLADELRGDVLVQPEDFHPRDQGDNGLDLVAWIPMHDGQKGVPSFFSQCACGKKWDGKQYEASYERWKEFIHLTSPPTKVTFIPHFFRRFGTEWYAKADVSGVLIDRLRALRIAPQLSDEVLPVDLIEEVLAYRLSAL